MVLASVKEEAIKLREQGKTYPEISSTLNGAVSVDWCKRNLKNVVMVRQKVYENSGCLEELISLATRPEGCTDYEAKGVIFKYYADATNEKVRYLKRRSISLNKECLYRPDWIDPTKPRESHDAINAYAIHLMDEIDSLVDSYLQSYPSSADWAVKYELLKLACSAQISKEPLSKRLYRNELVAETLEDRVGVQEDEFPEEYSAPSTPL